MSKIKQLVNEVERLRNQPINGALVDAVLVEEKSMRGQIERLRQELEDHIRVFEQYEHWLDTMPEHLIETSRAVLAETEMR